MTILEAAVALTSKGKSEFTAWDISKELDRKVGYGTLYRTLAKLHKQGVLNSRWADEPSPRRRYYTLLRRDHGSMGEAS